MASPPPSTEAMEPCNLSFCVGISKHGDAADVQHIIAGGKGMRLIDAAYLLSDATVDMLIDIVGENNREVQAAVLGVYMMGFTCAAVERAGPEAMDGVREWIDQVLKEGE